MRQILLIWGCGLLSTGSAIALFTESAIAGKICITATMILAGLIAVGGILHLCSQEQMDVREVWRTKLEMAQEKIEALEAEVERGRGREAA